MELTKLQKRLVNAWAILILAERRELEEAPEELQNEIEIRKAEIEVEKLS